MKNSGKFIIRLDTDELVEQRGDYGRDIDGFFYIFEDNGCKEHERLAIFNMEKIKYIITSSK